jgi:4-pyridoxate dehydrogenase
MYFTEPEAALNGRRIECARGKVIGGSSSINAMAYVRGNPGDYDRWARAGCTGWSYEEVLPYFRRQESWEGGAGEFRGAGGPLTVQTTTYQDPLVEACLAAGEKLQMPRTPDYNGAQQEGLARMQQTIRDGRCSAAEAYLRPALGRPNLTVETGALANRILLEAGRAVGVEYVRGGEAKIARGEREVLLCGGVINSPQLLMLSGIGDPQQLAGHGIKVAAALPGVGKNLQDHLSVLADFARADTGPLVAILRLDRVVTALARAYCFGTGPAAETPSGWTGFVKSRPDVEFPDIQFLFRAVATGAAPYLPPFKSAYADGFSLRAVMLRPESRGEITLASADPRAPVRIRQNFLSTNNDRRTIRDGLKLVRRMAATSPLSGFVMKELAPGDAVLSDDELDAYIRATAATAHHPLGTCRMGPEADAMAVVDPELRVRGVEGLRVVDASAMPDLVGGNINAPVIMIAEKAADLIRGRAPLGV